MWIRTSVIGSVMFRIMPASMAKGATAEDMFPQLLVQTILCWPICTCPKL